MKMTGRVFSLALGGLAFFLGTGSSLRAHGETGTLPSEWWRTWDFDPATVTSLFAFGALYVAGLRSLRLATRREAC